MAFSIIRNDITHVRADAIVNSANPLPVCGGGSDAAVYAAAGMEELLAARERIGRIEPGHAAATPAFALPAKYVIHTVGPVWTGGENGERDVVRACYRSSLRLAQGLECQSVAFPLISTGTYGFPKEEALQIAVSEIRAFLKVVEMDVILVVFDRMSFVLSGQLFDGVDSFISEREAADRAAMEYGAAMASQASIHHLQPPRPENATAAGAMYHAPAAGMAPSPAAGMAPPSAAKTPAANASATVPPEHTERSERRRRRLFDGILPGRKEKRQEAIREEAEALREAADAAEAPAFREETAAEETAPEPVLLSKPRKTLDEAVSHLADTWQESLFYWIDEKGYSDTEVYKRANVDRKLFSKIRSNPHYQPKKNTAVAFALALQLNLDETKDLLARAGYALSPSSRFDLIIEYFIENGVYDAYTINLALFEHDEPLLGA